jgi:hypothetical protein
MKSGIDKERDWWTAADDLLTGLEAQRGLLTAAAWVAVAVGVALLLVLAAVLQSNLAEIQSLLENTRF